MASLSRFLLAALGAGASVKDYAHAAKTFRSNGFANAGRYKFLFHVYFNMNPAVGRTPRVLSYLVKRVELPKFSIDAKELNQYNRKQLVQTKIKYNPVAITFQDDNDSQVRELWRSYYNYYYADGRYHSNVYNFNDTYIGARLSTNWGLNAGSYEPFFTSIDIYSLHAGEASKVSLIQPIIVGLNHDTHDYADGSNLLEHTMNINYTSVKYENGYYSGTPGLGDFAFYDNTPSDLSGTYAGYVVDSGTGRVFQPGETFIDPYDAEVDDGARIARQTFVSENYNRLAASSMRPLQTDANIREQNNTNSPYVFPTVEIGSNAEVNPGSVDVGLNIRARSENIELDDDRKYLGIYEQGTWQRALEEKGYDPEHIAVANDYITQGIANGELNVPNNAVAQREAEKFLRDPVKYSQDAEPVYVSSSTNAIVNTNNLNVLEPVYNADNWQAVLLAKGYNDYDIRYAESRLAAIRIAPGADIVVIAENLIQNQPRSFR